VRNLKKEVGRGGGVKKDVILFYSLQTKYKEIEINLNFKK
jgi:hypothetical protein